MRIHFIYFQPSSQSLKNYKPNKNLSQDQFRKASTKPFPHCHLVAEKKRKFMQKLHINVHLQYTLVRQCCPFTRFSSLWLFVTPRSVARKAPLSMGFSKQDYWRGLLCPLPGDLPNPGIELVFSCISCIARGFFTVAPPNKPFGTHMLQNSKRIF